jgi:hypothetical protein
MRIPVKKNIIQKIDANTNPAKSVLFPIVPDFSTKVSADWGTTETGETSKALAYSFICPVAIYDDNTAPEKAYVFPFDAIIDVKAKMEIIKRNVAKSKRKGTIKGLWTQSDYEINIRGTIIGESLSDVRDQVKVINDLLSANKTGFNLYASPDFEALSISRIVVETWDFPFTQGEENQEFTMKAMSDDVYELLIEL